MFISYKVYNTLDIEKNIRSALTSKFGIYLAMKL